MDGCNCSPSAICIYFKHGIVFLHPLCIYSSYRNIVSALNPVINMILASPPRLWDGICFSIVCTIIISVGHWSCRNVITERNARDVRRISLHPHSTALFSHGVFPVVKLCITRTSYLKDAMTSFWKFKPWADTQLRSIFNLADQTCKHSTFYSASAVSNV